MKEIINILFVEDLSTDVEIAVREIKKQRIDFTYHVVDREEDFRTALNEFVPNIVISDYSMPYFDGMSALNIARSYSWHIPFIILTGSMNEETAVACMKSGADDYVIKEKIKRLPFAIKEAIDKNVITLEKKRIEKQLIESEKKFSKLFYCHSVVKIILDPDTTKIVEANNAAANFYGWSVDELKNMNFSQINTLSHNEVLNELELATKHHKNRLIFKQRIAKGEIRDVEIFNSKITLNNKEYLHLIVQDITDKKKAEEQLVLLSRAIDQTTASIIITNSEGDIVYVNPGFEKITGYIFEEVKNKNPRFLKSDHHSAEIYEELWKTITSGNTWEGEMKNKKKNGESYWLKSTISPILNYEGEISHFISVREETTEMKNMIEKLIEAKEKAEESDRLKTAFLANMSHEIRTPMNGILGFTDLLLEPELDEEEKEEYIELIHKSGQRLLNTVNDIVEISKIEAGAISISRTDVCINKCMKDIIHFFKAEAQKNGLDLILENLLPATTATINTDQRIFESILINLIKNAIKYSDTGKIIVGCSLNKSVVEFYVKDFGIGIPPNRLNAIFDRFEQADTGETRNFEGSGLGLAISKSYVEILGGQIWVKSKVKEGSTFYFTLPVACKKEHTH